jgi:putative PEP-CTERM system histidine kinase
MAMNSIMWAGVAAGVATLLYMARREPPSLARRALLWFLAAGTLECLAMAGLFSAADAGMQLQLHRLRLAAIASLAGPVLHFSLVYARGNAEDTLRRRRGMVRAVYVGPLLLAGIFWRDLAVAMEDPQAPDRILLVMGSSAVLVQLCLVLAVVFALTNLERTLRESVGTMRWRVKYTVLSIGVFGIIRLYSSSQEILYGFSAASMFALNAVGFALTCALLVLSTRRGSLQSVDLYVSEHVLVRSVTLVIAGLYLALVGVLALAVDRFGDVRQLPVRSLLVLAALLGAAVLLLSDRVRFRVRNFVSLHFKRPQHNYRNVWNTFTDETAEVMDPQTFCRASVEVIAQTLEALSVTLWLIDPAGRRWELGGSTALDQSAADRAAPPDHQVRTILRALAGITEPIDLRRLDADWAALLIQAHPQAFKPGPVLCLPLRSREDWLGLLLVGDRVSYAPFTDEDLSLLKTIGNHLSARLFAFRLADRLAGHREQQAFQTMATFFVHDLKNLASTLSLMLKNLVRHFDDPEFREDTIHTMNASVDRIDQMIQQLALLRGNPQLHRTPTSLDEIVSRVMPRLDGVLPANTTIELAAPDPIPIDPVQIEKVLVNLVLNACDAVAGQGSIQIATSRDDQAAVLEVRDTGVGMSPEFIRHSLFKPFETSKKNGLGIGLFHCKSIVEAHGGHIGVRSTEGEETVFRVSLPAATEGGQHAQDPDRG